MAKSPVGGSRAFLMGRIGSDVYSLGKDGKGKRQQVVRALAEEVANPRTSSQMFNRMIMSTIMQVVHGLSPIIDHSFDGVAKGQPSISEFIRRNYPLVKADAIAHPSSENKFGLVLYQQKKACVGSYVVSVGKAVIPSTVEINLEEGSCVVTLPADNVTVGALKEALGVGNEGYFTLVCIHWNLGVQYCRYRVNPDLADSTAITSSNIGSIFLVEGNDNRPVEIDVNVISWDVTRYFGCFGAILTQKVNGKFIHSSLTLETKSTAHSTADVALPTYPVGEEQFLNGGDI